MRRGFAVVCAALFLGAASPLIIEGQVAHPGPVAASALAGLKQVNVEASFATIHGAAKHRWSGPLLKDVLDLAAVQDVPGKHTRLRHSVLAAGADGYAVRVAFGEFLPEGENKQVIVALAQDGQKLDAPRLLVPGDHTFVRGVFDLTKLTVD